MYAKPSCTLFKTISFFLYYMLYISFIGNTFSPVTEKTGYCSEVILAAGDSLQWPWPLQRGLNKSQCTCKVYGPSAQPAKTSVSPRSSPLGAFHAEERLRLSDRNSILMTQINVYIINPVVMGFQIQICPILSVFWSILVKCCVHLPTSSSKTQTLLLEKSIFHKY